MCTYGVTRWSNIHTQTSGEAAVNSVKLLRVNNSRKRFEIDQPERRTPWRHDIMARQCARLDRARGWNRLNVDFPFKKIESRSTTETHPITIIHPHLVPEVPAPAERHDDGNGPRVLVHGLQPNHVGVRY